MARIPEIQEQGYSLDVEKQNLADGSGYIAQGLSDVAKVTAKIYGEIDQQDKYNKTLEAKSKISQEYGQAYKESANMPVPERRQYMADFQEKVRNNISDMGLDGRNSAMLTEHSFRAGIKSDNKYLAYTKKRVMQQGKFLGENHALDTTTSGKDEIALGMSLESTFLKGAASMADLVEGSENFTDPEYTEFYHEQYQKGMKSYFEGMSDHAIEKGKELELAVFMDKVARSKDPMYAPFKRFITAENKRKINTKLNSGVKNRAESSIKNSNNTLRSAMVLGSGTERNNMGQAYFNQLKQLHHTANALTKPGEKMILQDGLLDGMGKAATFSKHNDPFNTNELLSRKEQDAILADVTTALGQKLTYNQRATVLNSAKAFKAEMAKANRTNSAYNAYGIAKEQWPEASEEQIQWRLNMRGLTGVMSGDDLLTAMNEGKIINYIPGLKTRGLLPGLVTQIVQSGSRGSTSVALAHLDAAISGRVTGPAFKSKFPIMTKAMKADHKSKIPGDGDDRKWSWVEENFAKGRGDLADKISNVEGYESFYKDMVESIHYSLVEHNGRGAESAMREAHATANQYIKDNYTMLPGIGPIRKYPNAHIPNDKLHNFIRTELKGNQRNWFHPDNYKGGGKLRFRSGLSTGGDITPVFEHYDRRSGKKTITPAVDKNGKFMVIDRDFLIKNIMKGKQ